MSKVSRVESEGGYTTSGIWSVVGPKTGSKYAAVRALQMGEHVIYALRLEDGIIKIGCCKNLANRASGLHGQVIGFRKGDFDEEREIHASLIAHRARGWEYYHPTPEVMAVVNELRDEFGLPHLAA